eukprot:768726-Hanusia_phi.AAC.9
MWGGVVISEATMLGLAFISPAGPSFTRLAPPCSPRALSSVAPAPAASLRFPASPSLMQHARVGASSKSTSEVDYALRDLTSGLAVLRTRQQKEREEHEAFVSSLACRTIKTEPFFAPVEEKLYEFRLRSRLSRVEEDQALREILQPFIARALIILTILQVASQLLVMQAKQVIVSDTKGIQTFPLRVFQAVLGIGSRRVRKLKSGCVETFWC